MLVRQEMKCSFPSSTLIFCMAEQQCKVPERVSVWRGVSSDWVGFSPLAGIVLLDSSECLGLDSAF